MPDKVKYVQEMTRVLKPGGRIVIATWCQREEPPAFNAQERKTLDYLYGEWTHPYFISIEEYARIMQAATCYRRSELSGVGPSLHYWDSIADSGCHI